MFALCWVRKFFLFINFHHKLTSFRAFVKTINAHLGTVRWNEPSYRIVPVDEFTQLSHVDMAIYKLKDPITLNDYIQPIQLPTASQAFAPFLSHFGVILGWGGSSSLQYTQVLFLKNDLRQFRTVGFPNDTAVTVSGDSGSPLVIFENGIATQVGVHWGTQSNKYMFASHVGRELAWVREFTGIPIRKFTFQ